MPARLVAVYLFVALSVGACKSGNITPALEDQAEHVGPEILADLQSATSVTLPASNTEGSCALDTPQLCEWAASHDAVVYGSISAIGSSSAPAFKVAEQAVVDTCDGVVSNALVVTLEVISSHGAAEPTGSLTVQIGPRQLESWDPKPEFDDIGTATWGAQPDRGLYVGQHLVLPLAYIDAFDVWSPLGMPIVAAVSDDVHQTILREQPGDHECAPHLPSDVDGMELGTFHSSLGGCASMNGGANTFTDINDYKETSVPDWFLAKCYTNPDERFCRTDEDCGPTEICPELEGRCVPK